MQAIRDVQSFEHASMTLSLCLLYLQQEKLNIETAVTEVINVINISSGILDLSPDDSMLRKITKNLTKVGNLYLFNPQDKLLETPENDTLYQIRYNLRIAIDYITKNYV